MMPGKNGDPIIVQWTDNAVRHRSKHRIVFYTEVPTIYPSVFFRNAIVRAQASAASAGL